MSRFPMRIGVDLVGRLWDDHGRRRIMHTYGPGRVRALTPRELRMARGSGVGFTAAIIAISLAFLGDGPVRMLGIAAAIVGVGYGGARLMRLTWPSRWRRETVATRLTRGDCGACGLHIEDMPRDGNGCVRCPDCGATWLVDRLGGRVDDGW